MGNFGWKPTQLALTLQGPVLGSILILAAVKHDTIAFVLLVCFIWLGTGLPLLAIAYGVAI